MLLVAALSAGCGSSSLRSSASTAPTRHSSSLPAGGRVGLDRLRLGRSELGRAIVAVRAGDPHGVRVLVVGCIHGNEGAGIAVARALERRHAGADLWIV